MMVDPKMVELSVYNDIPHLLIPVVTNPPRPARPLQRLWMRWKIIYELFAKVGYEISLILCKVGEFNNQSTNKYPARVVYHCG